MNGCIFALFANKILVQMSALFFLIGDCLGRMYTRLLLVEIQVALRKSKQCPFA